MTLRTFVVSSVSALCGLCLALVIVSSTSAQISPLRRGPLSKDRTSPPQSAQPSRQDGPLINDIPASVPPQQTPAWGRFQLAIGPTEVYMTDTTNGDCWCQKGGEWISLGNPHTIK